MQKRIVFSGAPGVGKTMLVHLLKKNHNFYVSEEVFTMLFSTWIEKKEFDYMHENKVLMVDKLIQAQIQEEKQTIKNENNIAIFDRSMVDIMFFCKEIDFQVNQEQENLINNYNYDFVFIPEPLNRSFYDKNSIRRQTYEESLLCHEICLKSYKSYFKKLGLNSEERVVIIPRFSDEKNESIQLRMNFILDQFLTFK